MKTESNNAVLLIAPALLVDQSSVTFNAATVAGADRPVDLDALDIATMDDAELQLATWQASIADQGPPILQPDDVTSYEALFDEVRSEQELLSRVTLAAVVPLIVLALLLLFVLVASAAEVRRQEVALAKLRGFSTGKVVRFAVAEPATVLLLTVPVGIALAVVGQRVLSGIWLGPTPFVVTTQAVVSAVVVTATALLAAFVAVLGVVREPLAASLSSATRRRGTSTWSLLAQGALVMLSVAAVVQILTSDATQSSSFVELLAPLFVAIGASVVALVLIGMLARLWMRRTADARRTLTVPRLPATRPTPGPRCSWCCPCCWRPRWPPSRPPRGRSPTTGGSRRPPRPSAPRRSTTPTRRRRGCSG